jgi:hypothetical protein
MNTAASWKYLNNVIDDFGNLSKQEDTFYQRLYFFYPFSWYKAMTYKQVMYALSYEFNAAGFPI